MALCAGKRNWALLCAWEQHPCGDIVGEEQVPDILLPHGARQDAQGVPPPALSIPGSLPRMGKTVRLPGQQSKLHPSGVT